MTCDCLFCTDILNRQKNKQRMLDDEWWYMMKYKEILVWYKDTKQYYDENVDNNDMPEGDFNVLEAEYEMLRGILGYD